VANRFVERLQNGPVIVADGGMGVLVSSAAPRLRAPEEANLRAPETVVKLHAGFIAAGADLIETNTFGANRRKLATHYLEDEVHAINSSAVKLAREAREMAGRDVFIAGSIGPLGDVETVSPQERVEIFAEQAEILEGRGVDLFAVETFFDLGELESAIEAVRSVSSLPILAMLTFDERAETLAGVSAAEAVARLHELDVAAAGANHGAGIQAALRALGAMNADGLPLAAMPNIGLASMAGTRIIYPHATPEYFAEFAAHAVNLGAKVIGGCCGTTPTEIAAIAEAVKAQRAPTAPLVFAEREVVVKLEGEKEQTKLAQLFGIGEFAISVQIDPPLGGSYAGMLEVVRALQDSGKTHLVDINDNATARAAASALMLSIEIERTLDFETIPHLTTRDATIMGLESQLLGAHACGIRNVLSVTGDPPEVGDYPGSRGVYEVDSIGLARLMAHLNRGEDYNGRAIDAETSFYIGVAVNPAADDLDVEVERFRRKVEAGADFAMTQIVFDLEYMDRFVERIGGEWPIPVMLGIFPVWSHQLALRLHNEVPGIVVPERILNELRDAGPNANEVGMDLGRRLLAEGREKAHGAYVVAPFRRPLDILAVLDG
jgi:methionine synthase I (cobalamin-dependent)/5,10-methylenetetrahydrofolate reductase